MPRRNDVRVKRELRIPQLKMNQGQEYVIQALEPYVVEPSRDPKREGDVALLKVLDCDTGNVCRILLGAVLRNLIDEYDGDYVGRFFLVEVGELSEGEQGWRDYYLWEVDDPAEAVDDTAADH